MVVKHQRHVVVLSSINTPRHILRLKMQIKKRTVDVVSAAGASLPKADTVSFTEGVDV